MEQSGDAAAGAVGEDGAVVAEEGKGEVCDAGASGFGPADEEAAVGEDVVSQGGEICWDAVGTRGSRAVE